MMARILVLAYGTFSYLIFFGTFVYLFAFVGDLGVPKSVSVGAPAEHIVGAVFKNLA